MKQISFYIHVYLIFALICFAYFDEADDVSKEVFLFLQALFFFFLSLLCRSVIVKENYLDEAEWGSYAIRFT